MKKNTLCFSYLMIALTHIQPHINTHANRYQPLDRDDICSYQPSVRCLEIQSNSKSNPIQNPKHTRKVVCISYLMTCTAANSQSGNGRCQIIIQMAWWRRGPGPQCQKNIVKCIFNNIARVRNWSGWSGWSKGQGKGYSKMVVIHSLTTTKSWYRSARVPEKCG